MRIDYAVKEYEFEDRNDVKMWIIENQLGRRNLEPYDRSLLALKWKAIIAEKAKENMSFGGGDKKSGLPTLANPIEQIDTREKIAEMAGVSHGTIQKVENIEEKAIAEIKDMIRSGALSINQAAQAAKESAETQEEIVQILKENLKTHTKQGLQGLPKLAKAEIGKRENNGVFRFDNHHIICFESRLQNQSEE